MDWHLGKTGPRFSARAYFPLDRRENSSHRLSSRGVGDRRFAFADRQEEFPDSLTYISEGAGRWHTITSRLMEGPSIGAPSNFD